jgi:hypothetical protein
MLRAVYDETALEEERPVGLLCSRLYEKVCRIFVYLFRVCIRIFAEFALTLEST